ncbi:hypothetical protein B296_00012365 [Ensete ventricosum]|uniref:Uncharacterized protein n=1 Tax=Ensete ventricosum TaxID=4639 RepID=A0A427B0S2_ENSVE|nr:hypothetical protein B296_00012365 [Ensete ventricosum]
MLSRQIDHMPDHVPDRLDRDRRHGLDRGAKLAGSSAFVVRASNVVYLIVGYPSNVTSAESPSFPPKELSPACPRAPSSSTLPPATSPSQPRSPVTEDPAPGSAKYMGRSRARGRVANSGTDCDRVDDGGVGGGGDGVRPAICLAYSASAVRLAHGARGRGMGDPGVDSAGHRTAKEPGLLCKEDCRAGPSTCRLFISVGSRDRGARFLCHRPLTFPFPPRGFRFVLLLWLRNERKPIIDAMNAKQTVELESRVIFDLGTVPVV